MRHLTETEISEIVAKYRGGSTPIALIQNGTLSNESVILGSLSTVSEKYEDVDVYQPGIIVVGNVVTEHPSFFEEELQRVLHTYI